MHNEELPNLPGLGQPIPPTDPDRAALYLHPRPGMQVGYAPGDPRANPYAAGSHYQGQMPNTQAQPQQQPYPVAPAPQQVAPPPGFQPTRAHAAPSLGQQADYTGAPPVRGPRVYEPIAYFEVRGRKYGLRDLGANDCAKVYEILEEATTWGTNRASARLSGFVRVLAGQESVDSSTPIATTSVPDGQKPESRGEAWILPILGPFLGFRYVKDELANLIASIILDERGTPLTGEDLLDPRLFPWRERDAVYQALRQHPDLESFFGWFEGLRGQRVAAFGRIEQMVRDVVGGMDAETTQQASEQPEPNSTDGSE